MIILDGYIFDRKTLDFVYHSFSKLADVGCKEVRRF